MKNLFALKILNKVAFQLLVYSPLLKLANPWLIFLCLFAVLMMHSQKSYSVEIITQGYFKAGGPGSDVWDHTPYFPGSGTEEQQNNPQYNPDVACAQYGMRVPSISEITPNGRLYSNGFIVEQQTLYYPSSRTIIPFLSSLTYANSLSTSKISSFGNVYPKHKAAYKKAPFIAENELPTWNSRDDVTLESLLGTIYEFRLSTGSSDFYSRVNSNFNRLYETLDLAAYLMESNYYQGGNIPLSFWLAEVTSKDINPEINQPLNSARMYFNGTITRGIDLKIPITLFCVEDLY